MSTPFIQQPGVRTLGSLQYKSIFTHDHTAIFSPSNKQINGSLSRDPSNTSDVAVLQAGLLLGKITATGLYAPSVIGLSGVLHDTSVVTTTMTLPAAVVTEIARRVGASGTFKIIGPPTAAGTVATETVTYSAIASATTITITATSADFAAGSIIAPTDGSETIKTIVTENYGIALLDPLGTAFNPYLSRFLVGGDIAVDQIINYTSADASIKTVIRDALNAVGTYRFSDNF